MGNLPNPLNKTHQEIEYLLNKAKELSDQGDLLGAKNIYEKLLANNPNDYKLLCNLGIIFFQINDLSNSISLLTKAVNLNPIDAAVYANLGLAHQALGQYQNSIKYYDCAINLKPDLIEAHMRKGLALQLLYSFEEAIISYDEAIKFKTDNPQLWVNRGITLAELNRFEEAIVSCDNAISLNPKLAEAHVNRGRILQQLNRFEEAIISYDKAINLNPNLAEIYCNLGYLLVELHKIEDAIVCCDKAIKLKPNLAEAYANRGTALSELRQFDEAINYYDKAINLKPDLAKAYVNRGHIFEEIGSFGKAINDYELALELDSNIDFLIGTNLFANLKLCDWKNYHKSLDIFKNGITNKKKVSPPYAALTFIDCPLIHLINSKTYVDYLFPKNESLGQMSSPRLNEKIRIGYYSSDLFVDHPIAYLTAEFFQCHNKNKFEIFAFSLTNTYQNLLKKNLTNYFSEIFEVHSKSDKEIAELSRHLGIDIAVDLGGYTKNSRPRIFSYRAAPIQVNFLGYPGTMAADYIDYIVADKTVISEENKIYFSEKICYLPNSYMPFDTRREISEYNFSRIECGLPEDVFVYACFNNSFKISGDLFEVWMRILRKTSNSVLWLSNLNTQARGNLICEANKWSIHSSRIIFANHLDKIEDHLKRQTLADLFLDTSPYNGHTTSLNALWAGQPVLTLKGRSFASRVTASFLSVLGLSELITSTFEEYESKAIELFEDSNKLQEIKQLIKIKKQTTTLFNTKLFTEHVEAAYFEMHKINKAAQAPVNLYILN